VVTSKAINDDLDMFFFQHVLFFSSLSSSLLTTLVIAFMALRRRIG